MTTDEPRPVTFPADQPDEVDLGDVARVFRLPDGGLVLVMDDVDEEGVAEQVPDGAVELVPVADEKGRDETYWRGHADGRLAQLAGADVSPDEARALRVTLSERIAEMDAAP